MAKGRMVNAARENGGEAAANHPKERQDESA